jgi:hypothetical protein
MTKSITPQSIKRFIEQEDFKEKLRDSVTPESMRQFASFCDYHAREQIKLYADAIEELQKRAAERRVEELEVGNTALAKIAELTADRDSWADQASKWGNDVLAQSAKLAEAERENAALRRDVERYQEKADAIHRYLIKKEDQPLLAVITELSLDSQRRAAINAAIEPK